MSKSSTAIKRYSEENALEGESGHRNKRPFIALRKVVHLFTPTEKSSATPKTAQGAVANPALAVDEGGDKPNRFLIALDRIQSSIDYTNQINSTAPYGYYMGRPVIGECTSINGGIYVGAASHEAIVVDRKYVLLDCLEAELISRIEKLKIAGPINEREIVGHTLRLTRETVRYDNEGTLALIKREKLEADQKVALDIFIKERVGLARHQVLLAAYLLESLKRRNLLNGCLFLDFQMRNNGKEDERLVYTCLSGQLLVFDPAAMEEF